MVAAVVATHLIYVICNGVGQAVTYEPVTAPKLCRSDLGKLCQINYSDPISATAVGEQAQKGKIGTNKEPFCSRKYFICSIFSSIQSPESQGTSGNLRENENEPNYRQKHVFVGICVKSIANIGRDNNFVTLNYQYQSTILLQTFYMNHDSDINGHTWYF